MFTASHLVGQQTFNNEWINFNLTYYKFKVGSSGIYRIPQSTLAANGLSTASVRNILLWRNGKQVPFYSTVSSGTLSPSDYIEFWGEANDGKPDRPLYRDPAFQHTDKLSLSTDTAAYFLTVDPAVTNTLITQISNDIAGNT